MAITRALAAEDANLNSTSLVTSRSTSYSDIDLTLGLKPGGDVYKKLDAAAVKQSVKNLLLTGKFEKPFNPHFGGGLYGMLFELANEDTADEVRENIIEALEIWEPRAKIVTIDVTSEDNDLNVYVEFRVVNTNETVTYTTSLSRLR